MGEGGHWGEGLSGFTWVLIRYLFNERFIMGSYFGGVLRTPPSP